MKNKVCAVVVTYNRLSMLEECLEAIKRQSYECDVLVINNSSTDNTESFLKENEINHFTTNTNIGGAGGFNIGIRKAYEAGYDCIWIMDDDCIPNKDALNELMAADRILKHNYGYLSSIALWIDKKECIMNRQKISRKYYKHVELMTDGIIQVEQSTFVSLLIPKKTILKVGLPIKEYFIWGDDIEYTRRIAQKNNMPCYMVGKSVVIHKTANNLGSDISNDDLSRIERYKYAYRNESYTYRQYGAMGIIKYLARCMRGVLRIAIYSKEKKAKRLLILLKGMISGIAFSPKIEYI